MEDRETDRKLSVLAKIFKRIHFTVASAIELPATKTTGLLFALFMLTASHIDRGDFGPFDRSLNTTDHGYTVIEDPTGSAPTKMVERFEVRPGDCGEEKGWSGGKEIGWSDFKTDRERSELAEARRSGRTPAGAIWWYGWSFYVPNEYPNVYPTKVALSKSG